MNAVDVVECRPEILEGEPEGIVYVERVDKIGAPESNPNWVFDHTCLLDDEKLIVRKIEEKLSGTDDRGSFLILGAMGSGKSHQLLLVYHLLRHPNEANSYLKQCGFEIKIPLDSKVVVAQMKQEGERYEYLWDLIFERLQLKNLVGKINRHSPGKETLEKVFKHITADKKPVAIILDEVEPWLNEVKDGNVREMNRFFLERLAEIASDSNFKVMLFTAIRGDFDEPKRTLSRTKTITLNLSASGERVRIVLFRLFRNIDKEKARRVISPYVKEYVRHKEHELLYGDEPEIEAEMLDFYPFHPRMLSALAQRYTSHPAYQSTRGLLGLLSSVIRDLLNSRDLILLGDVSVKRYKGPLSILDAPLVRKAEESIDEARQAKIFLGEEIVSTLFFYSLTDKERGATSQDILFSTYRPQLNLSEILHSILSVSETCTYVRPSNGKYILGPENPESMVTKRAVSVSSEDALGEIAEVLSKKIVRGVTSYLMEIKEEHFEDNKNLKTVFTLKREDKDEVFQERLESFLKSFFPEYQNTVLFIAPERGVDLTLDEEIILAAKKAYAARELAKAEGALTKQFQDIMNKKIGVVESRLRSVDWNMIRWIKLGKGKFSMRPIQISGEKLSWFEMIRKLRDIWGKDAIRDAVKDLVKERRHVPVKKILDEFSSLKGQPVLAGKDDLLKALGDMCWNREVVIEQGGKRYVSVFIDVETDAAILDPSMITELPPEAPPRMPEGGIEAT